MITDLEKESLAWVERGCFGEWTGAHLECLRNLQRRGLVARRVNNSLQPREAGNAYYVLTAAGKAALTSYVRALAISED